MKNESEIRRRNPLVVLVWTFGLFLLVYTTQYVYFWIGSKTTGAAFGALAGGEIKTCKTIFLRGAIGLLLGIPVLFLVVKFLWRRSSNWMRLRFRAGYLAGGAALGIAVGLAVYAVVAIFSVVRITAWPARFSFSELGLVLIGHFGWVLFKSTLEETVFRGMAVREFGLRWGWPAATLAGGLYFAAIHLISIVPILTPSLIIGILAAGIAASALFVALYIRSSSLWLPIGFHAGWNFALSAILGTTMSGKERSFGLFQVELSGQKILTGGEFGVEMSVVAVALMIILTICVLSVPVGGKVTLLSSRSGCKPE